MGKKKPRFFCDGCGTEVSADTDICPRCGKFFASIRCPRCGLSGDAGAFGKGCPACGYPAPRSNRGDVRLRTPRRGGAPPWLYAVCIALFALLVTALFVYISR